MGRRSGVGRRVGRQRTPGGRRRLRSWGGGGQTQTRPGKVVTHECLTRDVHCRIGTHAGDAEGKPLATSWECQAHQSQKSRQRRENLVGRMMETLRPGPIVPSKRVKAQSDEGADADLFCRTFLAVVVVITIYLWYSRTAIVQKARTGRRT